MPVPRGNTGPEMVLKTIDIFSNLNMNELCSVYDRMHRKQYGAGETLFREGDKGDELYVVLDGTVAISVTQSDGQELVISRIAQGNFFGEMSIIEHSPRSATCRTVGECTMLSLRAEDFHGIVHDQPEIASRIMRRMLAMTTSRLLNTDTVLTRMVQWGEASRKRAVTDEATGLYNRRFLDDSIESMYARAMLGGKPMVLAMFDLDHFGDLNKTYGQEFCDTVIVEIAKSFGRVFREGDILVRYGGDEFTFLFPDTPLDLANDLCERLCREIRAIQFPAHVELSVSASIGLASTEHHAESLEALKSASDKALYRAKELGRDRAFALRK